MTFHTLQTSYERIPAIWYSYLYIAGSGILSWNPEENPFLYSANVVYVPYCSSDAFAGNNTKSRLYVFIGFSLFLLLYVNQYCAICC